MKDHEKNSLREDYEKIRAKYYQDKLNESRAQVYQEELNEIKNQKKLELTAIIKKISQCYENIGFENAKNLVNSILSSVNELSLPTKNLDVNHIQNEIEQKKVQDQKFQAEVFLEEKLELQNEKNDPYPSKASYAVSIENYQENSIIEEEIIMDDELGTNITKAYNSSNPDAIWFDNDQNNVNNRTISPNLSF